MLMISLLSLFCLHLSLVTYPFQLTISMRTIGTPNFITVVNSSLETNENLSWIYPWKPLKTKGTHALTEANILPGNQWEILGTQSLTDHYGHFYNSSLGTNENHWEPKLRLMNISDKGFESMRTNGNQSWGSTNNSDIKCCLWFIENPWEPILWLFIHAAISSFLETNENQKNPCFH